MRTGLEGKTALITGASRGIGKAIAFALAEEGANVVLTSRRQESLDEVAAEIKAAHPGAGVLAKAAHVGDAAAASAAIDAAITAFGGLDVLVNNAGVSPHFGPLVEIDAGQAAKTVEINQYGVVLWTQLAWKAAMERHGGTVINIASIGGMVTEHNIGYYNATKAAVIHLTRQFAVELAPKVRVNAIAPGLVKTKLASGLWEGNEDSIAKALPLGRLGVPEDIAGAAVFLAGECSSWMTGQTMVVDGGSVIRPAIA
ncbi:NAD(P)-dependent dehydrogenase (short-subunit alcohol dehydrogenase family) [Actinocorallia herbida]|uniref:NAD(P)-dependent dehydrogenase (Short-subunit alcohol dehydrogenase family) n=1 Tax=Actinocorallia herbida TaxID=58109 RepID=A0A3N1D9X6_9ACTN|nr:SDR family oxidoreductase [Actinocorallia herbida]ROO89908.1 NAD(P)-dependent dehydrogenase (short-subunit alcohol dehydrogenase family) [Actinocorallia herbida]